MKNFVKNSRIVAVKRVKKIRMKKLNSPKLCVKFLIRAAVVIFVAQLGLRNEAGAQNTRGLFQNGKLDVSSFMDPDNRKCYRWVSEFELKKWLGKKMPFFQTMGPGESQHLERFRSNPRVIWCWSSPMGTLRGGNIEYYGDYLLEITLSEDRVLYDRNLNTYDAGPVPQDQIPEKMRKGVDSEVVYGNYSGKFNGNWFQEIMIKDAAPIVSWRLGGADIKELLRSELEEVLSDQNLPWQRYHFYYNYCSVPTGHEDLSNAGYRRNSQIHACATYRELAKARWQGLLKFWADHPEYETTVFENPKRRKALNALRPE
jgi:hypothetical protein